MAAISGDLSVMTLPDLLQWAGLNRKSGVLELEHNMRRRRITFREGRIVSCSADDPQLLLGQQLLSRGMIDQETLREALTRQESTGQFLGVILKELGAVGEGDVERLLESKAREAVLGLFEWTDAVFRFFDGGPPDPYAADVDLAADELLLEGVRRRDELERIRKTLSGSVVLQQTGESVPEKVLSSPMATRILEAVDGKRTLAEILLYSHASEFLAIQLLFRLLQRGVLEKAGIGLEDPERPTLLDVGERGVFGAIGAHEDGEEPDELDEPIDEMDAPAAAMDGRAPAETSGTAPGQIDRAAFHTARGEHSDALRILNACYAEDPGNAYLRYLVEKAEDAFVEQAELGGLLASSIPIVGALDAEAEAALNPTEHFLLGMIDGKTDVQSILWVAPLREKVVLITLEQMRVKGMISLREIVVVEAPPKK